METAVQKAIQIVNGGGIIIFPTDTAFGIGCRLDNHSAIDRLFSLRRRPISQATPVLVDSEAMALPFFDSPNNIVRHYMKTYWPGALTIVAPCHKNLVYSPVRGGGSTIGLRMPNHTIILDIIRGVGVPILGPSANFHGDPTPYRQKDLNAEFVGLVDFVVPGRCSVGLASTVVDCSSVPPKVLRQGAVAIDIPYEN
jgi:L-threonylcarbamoyladenylate synthase